MASQDQGLAAFIKSAHESLRQGGTHIPTGEAWDRFHVLEESLDKCLDTMRILAFEHLEENAKDADKGANSRVQWVTDKCVEYFIQDRESEDFREENALQKLEPSESACKSRNIFGYHEDFNTSNIDLLDVGSCNNPFAKYPMFKVLPIDLVPATQDVYQCDFLKVVIRPKGSLKATSNHCSITQLEKESFDVVVFSLLLENLPSPGQRYDCVTKAYEVLKPAGLLFIITPDSKHSTANALMKSWRTILVELGFSRVYYEKLPHIHCMAYRKCRIAKVAKQWALRARKRQGKQSFMATHGISEGLYIPQDMQQLKSQDVQEKPGESDDVKNPIERSSFENKELVEMFQQLPEEYM